MKIFTLKAKGEVLAILTHNENYSYRRFKEVCEEANEEAENDFYTLKDILVEEHGFIEVRNVGGFEVLKEKGNL